MRLLPLALVLLPLVLLLMLLAPLLVLLMRLVVQLLLLPRLLLSLPLQLPKPLQHLILHPFARLLVLLSLRSVQILVLPVLLQPPPGYLTHRSHLHHRRSCPCPPCLRQQPCRPQPWHHQHRPLSQQQPQQQGLPGTSAMLLPHPRRTCQLCSD